MIAHDGRNPPKQANVGMSTSIFDLRPALKSDFDFCKTLYKSSMKPLLSALDAWDEQKATTTFKGYFKTEEIQIISVDGCQAGWIQVSETESAINIDQIHLFEKFRALGIGTRLINNTKIDATRKEKPVLLSLIRGNTAVKLYQRLGFEPDGKDDTKFHMRWDR
ncbi:MAG: GNAT family N-acetyltransferase [Hyphomicrobiales bacterium]|nr:GNAT family N-acetyltransferase [Hyphomicrobiales bacterium]